MNRHFVLPAAALYAVYLALTVWCIAKKRERAALFALLTLAAIGANLALVSLTIFCQGVFLLAMLEVIIERATCHLLELQQQTEVCVLITP